MTQQDCCSFKHKRNNTMRLFCFVTLHRERERERLAVKLLRQTHFNTFSFQCEKMLVSSFCDAARLGPHSCTRHRIMTRSPICSMRPIIWFQLWPSGAVWTHAHPVYDPSFAGGPDRACTSGPRPQKRDIRPAAPAPQRRRSADASEINLATDPWRPLL